LPSLASLGSSPAVLFRSRPVMVRESVFSIEKQWTGQFVMCRFERVEEVRCLRTMKWFGLGCGMWLAEG
jgi:hypothetical protein